MTSQASTPQVGALLEWLAERSRSYAETMEAWKTSCPRLAVWEDALAHGLVHVSGGRVLLSPAGEHFLRVRD